MKLWLDDERPAPLDYDIHVRSATLVIMLIQLGLKIDHISFDHDLGLNELNGYALACYIENKAYNKKIPKLTWNIHSANPAGRRNIELAMRSAERFWASNDAKGNITNVV